MQWRLAESLVVLRDQLNQLYPNRSKLSDGTIGDAAHAASVSDHNPNSDGVVTAFDGTHDPAHGIDIAVLAETLRVHRDPRIKYVIANRRIFAGNDGPSPWVWRNYTGTDPHTNHLHLSVLARLADSTRPWAISPSITQEEPDMTPAQEAKLDEAVRQATAANTRVQNFVDTYGPRIDNASVQAQAASVRTQLIRAELDPAELATQLASHLDVREGVQISDDQLRDALRAVLGSLDDPEVTP